MTAVPQAKASSSGWQKRLLSVIVAAVFFFVLVRALLPPGEDPDAVALTHLKMVATDAPVTAAPLAHHSAAQSASGEGAPTKPVSRRPKHGAVGPVGIYNDAVFYGLFGIRTRAAFEVSPGILQGKVHVTPDAVKHALTTAHVQSALQGSGTCDAADTDGVHDAPRGSSKVPALLCTFARNKAKTAVEWVQWHLITGWRRMVIYDDGENGNAMEMIAAATSGPDVPAGLVTVIPTTRRNESTYEQAQAAAAQHCAELAREAGSPMVVMTEPDEFIAVPGETCAPRALYARVFTKKAAGIALPILEVGHSRQFLDNARSQFERTAFVGGNVADGSGLRVLLQTGAAVGALPSAVKRKAFGATPARPLIFAPASNESAPAEILEPATEAWPAKPGPSQPRVFKFISRSLAHVVTDALCMADRPGAPAPFDVNILVKHWEGRINHGYTVMEPELSRWLIDRHALLLKALGFTATARRERFAPAPGGRATVEELLRKGVLRWARPDYATSETPGNAALAKGKLVVVAEPASPTLTKFTTGSLQNPKCIEARPPTIGNLTFCGYVRNRAKLTQEWVAWHRLMGVSHFHIFDDGSTDGLEKALSVFIDMGFVTLRPAPTPPYNFKGRPVKGGLLAAYADCDNFAAEAGGENAWVGWTDPDEFIVLEDHACLPDYIAETIYGDKAVPASRNKPSGGGGGGGSVGPRTVGVAMPWMEVSHRQEMVDTSPTQLERTGFGAGDHDGIERVKCIVMAGVSLYMGTAHAPDLPHGMQIVLPDGKPLKGQGWFSGIKAGSVAEKRARLLHYHARSLASWIVRGLDGFADNDNEVRTFDVGTEMSRWHGAGNKGLATKIPEGHHARHLAAQVKRVLGYVDADATTASPAASGPPGTTIHPDDVARLGDSVSIANDTPAKSIGSEE